MSHASTLQYLVTLIDMHVTYTSVLVPLVDMTVTYTLINISALQGCMPLISLT